MRSGIRLKGSAERERVRALKARDARIRESEKSRLRESEGLTSHGANTLTEAKPVPTPLQSSGCAHEDTHAHRERVRLAPQAGPAREIRPARETRIAFETDPAREARPMREAMQVPETGYANGEWTTRTCEVGPSRESGQTREVDAECEWLEDHEVAAEEDELNDDQDEDMTSELGSAELSEGEGQLPDMDAKEMKAKGFYKVEAIMRSKYRHVWRFLVKWEGYSVAEATWEPYTVFILNHGNVSAVFWNYCHANESQKVLKLAEIKSKKEHEKHNK